MAEEDNYILGRGMAASIRFVSLFLFYISQVQKQLTRIRLDAQHLLWKLHTGYELHPQIPVTSDMKIAEVGCGTAYVFVLYQNLSQSASSLTSRRMWLFDVARQLPPTVQLHGFDISNSQFPPKELWPKNVTLGLLDSLVDPPTSLAGQYDVVHLRMWAGNLSGSDALSLILHVKRLLSEYSWAFS